jgi:hypothetical protein
MMCCPWIISSKDHKTELLPEINIGLKPVKLEQMRHSRNFDEHLSPVVDLAKAPVLKAE